MRLPSGWEWQSSWAVDMDSATGDKEGFAYASGFGSHFSPKSFVTATVRRRRLVRTAAKTLPPSSPPQYDLSRPSFSGFLHKEGGNVKSWKVRWFVLAESDRDVELRYYACDVLGVATTLKGTVLMSQVQQVRVAIGIGIGGIELVTGPGPHRLARTYRLRTDTMLEHEDWMRVLQVGVMAAAQKNEVA